MRETPIAYYTGVQEHNSSSILEAPNNEERGKYSVARQPMITRTVTTTKAKVLCLDIEQEKPFVQEVVLPRTYKDERSMLKRIRPLVENENVKVVHVQEVSVEETLYGMTEQQFIDSATKLPPRTINK